MISDACTEMGFFPSNQCERAESCADPGWAGGSWPSSRGVHGKLTLMGERNGEWVWQLLKGSRFAQIMLAGDDSVVVFFFF